MPKKFNITGLCLPEQHYMADISAKLKAALQMVEEGDYFVISRPRQYGKTTMLEALARALAGSGNYLVFNISFEGIGSSVFASEKEFCRAFLQLLREQISDPKYSNMAALLDEQARQVEKLIDLSRTITAMAELAGKKTILLVDEVDKSSDNQLFLDFLGMLRNKYLNQQKKTDLTFHSIILAGLYDVKSLKLKLRPETDAKYNSPWNIAADFTVDMSLQPDEIKPMLEDYARERKVRLDAPAIAQRLYFYTSGYPFLVSALCKLLDEKVLPQKSERVWVTQDVESAADLLIKAEHSNTNFDTVIKNLENNRGLYDLVFRMAVESESIPYNPHAPLIQFGMLHGILRNGQGLQVHNRIYREIIVNYMTAKMLTERSVPIEHADPYILPGNRLDMERVLLKFQEYLFEQYSKKDRNFLERNGRLVFLAFLKPIINGKGYAFKEPELSEERRLDIAVTFFQHRYVVELKIWRGEAAHQRGLQQLTEYLDRQRLGEGYLLIFDPRKTQEQPAHERIEAAGKRIFAVRV